MGGAQGARSLTLVQRAQGREDGWAVWVGRRVRDHWCLQTRSERSASTLGARADHPYDSYFMLKLPSGFLSCSVTKPLPPIASITPSIVPWYPQM